MEDFVKTNVPGLVKQKDGNLILNTAVEGYSKVLSERRKNKELQMLKNDVAILKQQVAEIIKRLDELTRG